MTTFIVFVLILVALVSLPAWGLHRYGYWPSGTIGSLLLFATAWSLL